MTVPGQHLALARRTLLRAGVSALALPMLPRKARAGQASLYLRKTQTRMPFWGSAGMFGGGQTLTAAFTCETPFWGVQPFWLNGDLAAHTIGSVAVAPTVVLNDAINPVNPSGQQDASLFVPATIGGQRSGTIPAARQGNSGIFPGNDRVHGLLLGDIVPVQSLPRMDGTLPLVLVRTYSSGPLPCAIAGDVLGMYPVGGGAFDAVSSGRIVRAGTADGDCATSPGIVQGIANQYLAPTGIIFHTNTFGLDVHVGGDSLFQGYGTATLQDDPFQMAAAALSTPSLPITICKLAYQGMPSASFMGNLGQMVAAVGPSVAVIKGESANDIAYGTQAGYQASLDALVNLGDWCNTHGTLQATATAMPYAETASRDVLRLAFNQQIRRSGWFYTDFDVVSDGKSPAGIQPVDSSFARAPHPGDAGNAAIAQSVQAMFQAILAS
ncbi:MAG: hypothetical protein ACRYG8_32770 [Janthinobacterium lividum]